VDFGERSEVRTNRPAIRHSVGRIIHLRLPRKNGPDTFVCQQVLADLDHFSLLMRTKSVLLLSLTSVFLIAKSVVLSK
jgi:hypothetical protein